MVDMKSLKGHFLVAAASLRDPNFLHSVTLLVQHDKQGALGVVLNRPMDITVRDLWNEISTSDDCEVEAPLLQGGPCEGPVMILHTHRELSNIQVLPGVHFTTAAEHVQALVARNEGPMKVALGYAGWSPGQLEQEILAGGWLTIEATADEIFGPADEQWRRLARRIALQSNLSWIDPKRIPDDPSVN